MTITRGNDVHERQKSLYIRRNCGTGAGGLRRWRQRHTTPRRWRPLAIPRPLPAKPLPQRRHHGSSVGDTTAATEPAAKGWTVDTSTCADPARAEQPIEGTVKIGSAMPLSGGPAAAFGPVKDGFQLYLNYASEKGLLPGYTLSADIRDDQYDATQTPGVVAGLIDDGVDMFSGIIGSPNNLAVRDTLNEECIPQLLALTGSPAWGQVADYPWTTGALVPYDIEASIYATKLNELKPGAKVALFYVNNEFGKAYVDEFKKKATEFGFQIVDEQTIEAGDNNPPTTQVGSIAGKQPDAIMAIPLGLQCPAFLTELANAKAQNAAWAPLVFITNTCASKLFFGLAGPAAEGVYTSNNLVDSNDPKNASNPGHQGLPRRICRSRPCRRPWRDRSWVERRGDGRHLERCAEDGHAEPQVDHRGGPQPHVHPVLGPRRRAVQDERR